MKKKVLMLLAAGLCAAFLSGCASGDDTENIRLMVWSPSEDQSKDKRGMAADKLRGVCQGASGVEYYVCVRSRGRGFGGKPGGPGRGGSADVFMFANDTLTTMTDANALVKFGGKYREEIESSNSQALLDSLMKDGELYGVPFTTNTWFMYYGQECFFRRGYQKSGYHAGKGRCVFPLYQFLVSAGILSWKRLYAVRRRNR